MIPVYSRFGLDRFEKCKNVNELQVITFKVRLIQTYVMEVVR